jgi:glutathione-regulated potassium-efflux system ancillary protein KefG
VGRKIDVDDLIDANEVARLLGLAHRNSVTTYLNRYPDMPRPTFEIRESRIRLWARPEILSWATRTGRRERRAS